MRGKNYKYKIGQSVYHANEGISFIRKRRYIMLNTLIEKYYELATPTGKIFCSYENNLRKISGHFPCNT